MKRSRHKIVSEILDICMNGASKTRIVYQANLNFRTVNPYIDILIEKNLIKVERGQMVRYHTTERGMNLLNEINRIYNDLSEL
jgi:predicted transcriptional regulator